MTRLSSCQLTVVGPPCQTSASSTLAEAGELRGVEGVRTGAQTVPAIPRVLQPVGHRERRQLTPSSWRREGSCCSLKMTEGDSCPGPALPYCGYQTVLESVCPAGPHQPPGQADLRPHLLHLLHHHHHHLRLASHCEPGSGENHRASRGTGTGFQLATRNSSQLSHSNLALIPQLS